MTCPNITSGVCREPCPPDYCEEHAPNADLGPHPDAELYDGSPVHQESYRRGYRNGYEDGLATAKAQLDELVAEYEASPIGRSEA